MLQEGRLAIHMQDALTLAITLAIRTTMHTNNELLSRLTCDKAEEGICKSDDAAIEAALCRVESICVKDVSSCGKIHNGYSFIIHSLSA